MSTANLQTRSAGVRYEILGRLATGGMAELFLARVRDPAGDRHLVLKRVRPERATDRALAAMFLEEARLAALLHHPNIAQVHDLGRLGDSYFYTMEYVHGEDCRELLARLATLGRALPISHALHVAASVAAGLHHAHECVGADGRALGIVHRDVSPSNVMVSFDGAVKVVDFGVAKATARPAAHTEAGAIKGKVGYLSPEQCRGRPIDRRSDIFSLGILLHELLTGARLYRRGSDYETMEAIVLADVAPPSRQRPDVTPALDRVVATALAKDPGQRFPDAAELVAALEAVAGRDGFTISPAGAGRFLRELFGDRPEPWLGLAAHPDAPPPVTVVGEVVLLTGPDARVAEVASSHPSVEIELRKAAPLRAVLRRQDDDEPPPDAADAARRSAAVLAPPERRSRPSMAPPVAARPSAAPDPVDAAPTIEDDAAPTIADDAAGTARVPAPGVAAAVAIIDAGTGAIPVDAAPARPTFPGPALRPQRPSSQSPVVPPPLPPRAAVAEVPAESVARRDPPPPSPSPRPRPATPAYDAPPLALGPALRAFEAEAAAPAARRDASGDPDPDLDDDRAAPGARPRRPAMIAIGLVAAAAVIAVGVGIARPRGGGGGARRPAGSAVAADRPRAAPGAATFAPGPAGADRDAAGASAAEPAPAVPAPVGEPGGAPTDPSLAIAAPELATATDPDRPTAAVARTSGRHAHRSSRGTELAALDQIRDAVGSRDFSRALGACADAARHALTRQVRGACALAACAAKREDAARRYSTGLPEGRKLAIRQSCLSRGISID